MSNQTVSANLNFDSASISGLTNGDDITIDTGAILTINSDVRWGQNAAVIGGIAINSTSGGKVVFDGRDVWWVSFDASSGNVPALGTVGTPDVTRGGDNVGEFLGIFTALGVAPSAAGGAMPSSGFIKLRNKTVTFADNDVLTFAGGATATLSSATGGQRGWIHIVGEEAQTINIPKLGELRGYGDFFQIGETSGADDQTFQYPVADNCPVLFIEDGAGGYEIWLNAGSRWGNATPTISQDVRGKFFGCDNSTGVITIARRATNACGYKPASGRKVYVPNIIISSSTSADWAANTINATAATRWDITTTSGGNVYLEKVTGTWNILASYAYLVEFKDCGFIDSVQVDGTIYTVLIDRCGFAVEGASIAAATPLGVYYTQNAVIQRCAFVRGVTDAANRIVVRLTTNYKITLQDSYITVFQAATGNSRASTTQRAVYASDDAGLILSGLTVVGGDLEVVSSSDIEISGIRYAYLPNAATDATNSHTAAVLLSSSCTRFEISDFDNISGLSNVHPYAAIVYITTGCSTGIVENIGTAASEYECGSANACLYAVVLITSHNIITRRVYVKNTRGQAVNFALQGRSNYFLNVWGDAADTLIVYGADDTQIRGCRWTNSTTAGAAVYGLHWMDIFTATTTGRLIITGNAPTEKTASQCTAYNTATFNGIGGAVFPATDDYVIWVMSYFMLGHTAFDNTTPTLSGTNTGFLTMEFQYDTGSGWNGSWLALSGANLSGIGSFSAATGIKLQIRATKTAGAAAVLNYCRIDTVTDATSQQTQYPLTPVQSRFTVYNMLAIDSSDITVLQMLARIAP